MTYIDTVERKDRPPRQVQGQAQIWTCSWFIQISLWTVVTIVTEELSNMIHRQGHGELHGRYMRACHMPPDKEASKKAGWGPENRRLPVDKKGLFSHCPDFPL